MTKVIRRMMPKVIHTGPGMPPMVPPATSIAALRAKYMATGKSKPYRSKENLTGETDDNGRLLGPELANWIIRDSDLKKSLFSKAPVSSDESSLDPIEHNKFVPDNYQYSLNLERIEDREKRLQSIIDKYEETFKTLGMYALRWHYLMEDVEENTGVADMFENMQLLRRLSGGKVF